MFARNTLDEIKHYYSFDLHNHEPWHDFEKALGSFDSKNFFRELLGATDQGLQSARNKG